MKKYLLSNKFDKKKISKIIFLDIDGVLNCYRSKPSKLDLETDLLNNLLHIVNMTKADVFLTSSWSNYLEIKNGNIVSNSIYGKALLNELYIRGINLIGISCNFPTSCTRSDIILDFLNSYNVLNYVILDDESFDYIEKNLGNNFVKTYYGGKNDNPDDLGLSINHTREAINILNGLI